MKYVFAAEKTDYSDFASGRVLYSAPGTTGFPVRLADEIIQRAFHSLEKHGNKGPFRIYDPCCGGGFLLTTLGFLFPERILDITATDIDPKVLEVAAKNLSLLSAEGLDRRERELASYAEAYGKDSHREALESLARLRTRLGGRSIKATIGQRDITDPAPFPAQGLDIIVTDIPYGQMASWGGTGTDPVESLFANCYRALTRPLAVLVIVADRKARLQHEAFRRIGHFKLGKRQIAFFQPLE
jgi:SAM-dependent methyltransferase